MEKVFMGKLCIMMLNMLSDMTINSRVINEQYFQLGSKPTARHCRTISYIMEFVIPCHTKDIKQDQNQHTFLHRSRSQSRRRKAYTEADRQAQEEGEH